MASKIPAYYRAPLRSRQAIIAFLYHRDRWHYDHDARHYLTWNVKVHGARLDFEHLLQVGRTSVENMDRWCTPEGQAFTRRVYDTAQNSLHDVAIEECQRLVTDSDCYKMLCNGNSTLPVVYNFIGRSGGYISLYEYCHQALWGNNLNFRGHLMDMPWDELYTLYRLVVQNDHDFGRHRAVSEYEHQAAYYLFTNCCEDAQEAAAARQRNDARRRAMEELAEALHDLGITPEALVGAAQPQIAQVADQILARRRARNPEPILRDRNRHLILPEEP